MSFFSTSGILLPGKLDEVISPADMSILAAMANVAGRHEIGLLCGRCQDGFSGKNDEAGGTWTIECACRRLVAHMGSQRPA